MGTTGPDAPVLLLALSDGDPGMRHSHDTRTPAWHATEEWRRADPAGFARAVAGFIEHERRVQRILDLRRSQRRCERESVRLGNMGYVAREHARFVGEALERLARVGAGR